MVTFYFMYFVRYSVASSRYSHLCVIYGFFITNASFIEVEGVFGHSKSGTGSMAIEWQFKLINVINELAVLMWYIS